MTRLLILLSLLLACTLAAQLEDYDVYPAAKSADPKSNGLVVSSFDYPTPGTELHVHVAISSNPVDFFAIIPAPGSGGNPFQCVRANTSHTARVNNCQYANNGGFFDTQTGACIGNVVSNGVLLQSASGWNHPNFGLSKSGNWVIGYYAVNSTGITDPFANLVTGLIWLIRDSKPYLEISAVKEQVSSGFLKEHAPRTALAIDDIGRVVLVQIDGEEDISYGPSLFDVVEILNSDSMTKLLGGHTIVSAVNQDGGGSSVSVYDGQVISKPTCIDTPRICERPVTTISCILYA